MKTATASAPRVLVIGGGFGGLYAARALRDLPVRVLLIDKRNFHLFQPLLYQVATGGLSPANIAAPLRSVLSRQKNAEVLLAEAVDFDLDAREVLLAGGERIAYDYLVVAAGAVYHYFGSDQWAPLAPSLKTIEDAIEIRSRILSAFEAAERAGNEEERRRCLSFAVIGGGPTGVELAGAIAEIARDTLRHEFRNIATTGARIYLIEAAERILATYPASLSRRAVRDLAHLGVEVRCNAPVTAIDEGGVEAGGERIEARTVLWAAGVRGAPLGERLARAAGLEVGRGGQVEVQPDLSLPGRPEVFVIGDLARLLQDGAPLPGVAPVAMQQGAHLRGVIESRLAGGAAPPFRYKDPGSMATIGRSAAIADFGRLRLTGFAGWLAWLTVHLMKLAGFENRLLVLTQWGWNYFTRNRAARLITGSGRDVPE